MGKWIFGAARLERPCSSADRRGPRFTEEARCEEGFADLRRGGGGRVVAGFENGPVAEAREDHVAEAQFGVVVGVAAVEDDGTGSVFEIGYSWPDFLQGTSENHLSATVCWWPSGSACEWFHRLDFRCMFRSAFKMAGTIHGYFPAGAFSRW